jgi:hypothetical protein
MLGIGLLSLGLAVLIIGWPGADHDDVLWRVHRNHHSARPATFADQGSGGNGNSLSGAAAARTKREAN